MIGRDGQGPRNDPSCPRYADANHVCADKFGQAWDRENVGPRAGTHCAVVDLHALAKAANVQALGDLLASTMNDPDDEDRCERGLDDYR